MSLNDAVEAIPRKSMVLFFLVDTSGSMNGSKIGAVNAAIEEVMPELKSLSAENADAEVRIAALEFNSTVKWLTGEAPVPVDNFIWRYVDASGATSMGEAFLKLNDALSTKTFMQYTVGAFAPAIFLLSDGSPTDDFEGGLAELKKNKWFKAAIKVAVAIGEDADKNRLEEFTGSMASVLVVHNAAMLRKMIKFVSVRASQVASKSVQVSVAISAAASKEEEEPNSILLVKQTALNELLKQVKAEADSGDDEW